MMMVRISFRFNINMKNDKKIKIAHLNSYDQKGGAAKAAFNS